MRAAVLAIAALLAGCGSNPPAPEGELHAAWTRVEFLTDGTPAGPLSYILDCWSTSGGRRTVAVGIDVTNQTMRLTPGMWTCEVSAVSDLWGRSAPSEAKSKLIP